MLAQQLLVIDPTCYDAYLAVGVENYLLGLQPAPVRWVLHMTGSQTDKNEGLQRLRLTADKGHYLAPFARLLLAVAALRDKDPQTARTLLAGLAWNSQATSSTPRNSLASGRERPVLFLALPTNPGPHQNMTQASLILSRMWSSRLTLRCNSACSAAFPPRAICSVNLHRCVSRSSPT